MLLQNPPTQQNFKSSVKSKVIDFWEQKIRKHAASLTSLRYFQAQFMSFTKPHPMWSHATDSYSVNKLIVVARLLSGRYRCGSLLKQFS